MPPFGYYDRNRTELDFEEEFCQQPRTLANRIVNSLGDLSDAVQVCVTVIRQEQTPDGPITTKERKVFRS